MCDVRESSQGGVTPKELRDGTGTDVANAVVSRPSQRRGSQVEFLGEKCGESLTQLTVSFDCSVERERAAALLHRPAGCTGVCIGRLLLSL